MLLRSNLPAAAWGHAILHASQLITVRPSSKYQRTPHQLLTGVPPPAHHLRVFGCTVYVPLPEPKRTKLGPQRRLEIYMGFRSPSVIRFLEPDTGHLFTARFADCIFDEAKFPR